MTDSQLLVLGICIVFPISVLIFQIGFIVSALNRLNETLRSIEWTAAKDLR